MAELPKDTIYHYESKDGLNITVTMTELVRCKDCKSCITHEKILFCEYMGHIGEWRFRTETNFCSRGERKDEDNALV